MKRLSQKVVVAIPDRQTARAGFNLVEVCLALLVISLGLTTVFGLFGVGLHASDNAEKDTRMGLFARNALAGIEANSSQIIDWGIWSNTVAFTANATLGLNPALIVSPSPTTIEYPVGSGRYIQYTLNVSTTVFTRGRAILLNVLPDRYVAWVNPFYFYTVVTYMGM